MDLELARVACIAPPLTDETLLSYRKMIDDVLELELKEALEILYKCSSEWWNAPVSTENSVRAMTGTSLTRGPDVMLQKLDENTQKTLFDHIPWMKDILAIEKLVGEKLDKEPETPFKTMAYHLIWHAKELCNDREPITTDRIVA